MTERPGDVTVLLDVAMAAQARGDLAAARQAYEAAVAVAPQSSAAHLGLGRVLLAVREAAAALPHLIAAMRTNPQAAQNRDVLAAALRALGRFQEAAMQHAKAITLAPDDLQYRENYAATLAATGLPKTTAMAEQQYAAVLDREPDRVAALLGLGMLHIQQQQPQQAIPVLQRALQIEPDRRDVLAGWVTALTQVNRTAEALAAGDRLAMLYPDDALALSRRGKAREHAGDYAGALEDYAHALQAPRARKPEILVETEFARALLLLSLGRLREGWPLYRARMDIRNADPRGQAIAARLPAWDGVVRPGQRLLVWGEQGVGDQVLFSSMLPALIKTGADLVFCCDPRLVPLFARSLPGLRVVPLSVPVDMAEVDRLAAMADVQAGLGDIGALLRRDGGASPPPTAWLRPDPTKAAELRARYAAYGRRQVIGITWRSGNPRVGGLKSAALADWLPLLRQPDTLFVDMQYGDTAEERRQLKQQHGIEILHDDSIDAMQDLDGYTAQAAALDLLVGCSNSGIHLAAAAGTTCWVAVPSGPGRLWYWHLGRDDSPWYPHVRLFRQPPGVVGDWTAPIAAMAAALQARLQDGAV